ncbi:MAG: spermidine synthase [Planctomycetota bacterium]
MLRYCLTIFLGAFLLFQVQPIAAKLLLPKHGGVAAVWLTSMLFFQLVLLLGYLYVHGLRRWLGPRGSWQVQSLVCGLGCATLPIGLRTTAWEAGSEIAWPVIAQLAVMVGVAFFAVSATGPLIQYWQALSHPQRSPFRLYALSNFGSLAGLLTYPLLIEPNWGVDRQRWVWSAGYLLYVILVASSGWQVRGLRTQPEAWKIVASPERPRWTIVCWWVLLTSIASAMLMAATNLLCQEVASFPFLWVLPLTAYLLTFMICFERSVWYRRRLAVGLLLASGLFSLVLFHLGTVASLVWHMLGFTLVTFTTAFVCHGELERSKPVAEHLTYYFLMVSVGGLLGSAVIVLLMPHWLVRFFEFQGALLLATGVGVMAVVGGLCRQQGRFGWQAGGWLFAGLFLALMCVSSVLIARAADQTEGIVDRRRNEYGLVAVSDNGSYREMINGQTRHGRQFLSGQNRTQPIDYYDPTSGVGLAMQYLQANAGGVADSSTRPLKIGVIGLGGGVLATWLRPGDSMRFYEVNPQVVALAKRWFSYLSEARGETSVVVGDARVELERELKSQSQQFDLLIVAACSSESIPAHLLTRECQRLYWEHLRADGVLAIHISNRYLDLRSVLIDCGGVEGVAPLLFERRRTGPDVQECTWVLLSRAEGLLKDPLVLQFQTPWPPGEALVWTDDYHSVWPLIDWNFWVDWASLRGAQRGRGK